MLNKYNNHSFRLKTQKAISSLNAHENVQEEFKMKLDKLKKQIPQHCRTLMEGSWAKVQLLSGSSQFYQLYNQHGSYNREDQKVILKVLIKNFTGLVGYAGISSRAQMMQIGECEYKLMGEKIIKIRNPIINTGRVYFTVHSPTDFIVFKFKYEFAVERHRQSLSLKSSSVKLLPINRQAKSERYIHDRSRQQMLLNLKKGASSPRSIVLDLSKLESARVESVQKLNLRLIQAREKRVDIETYREKSKELRSLSHQCGNVLSEFKGHVGVESERRKGLVRNMAMLVGLVNLVISNHQQFNKQKKDLRQAVRMKVLVRKCAKRMVKISQQLKIVQPIRKYRELLPIYHHINLAAKIVIKPDLSKAREVLITCLEQTLIGVSINKAFTCSASYRGKVRTIQRYWKMRNSAQISVFCGFVNKQVVMMLNKYVNFNLLKEEFYGMGMQENLSWQYLKESSMKLKDMYRNYVQRMQQMEEIKQMNAEIREYNEKALKKNQKEQLDEPSRPCAPVLRYFRDIAILKGMVRSWFEIEYRKKVRKMSKSLSKK